VASSLPQTGKKTTGPRIWTERHVKRELEAFLAGRDEWPRAAEFAKAGKSVLRRAAARYGGPRRWADELGVEYVQRTPPVWTEQRVRRELARFLNGGGTFPTAGEFGAAGRGGLWRALRRTGGSERWALEFGVAPPSSHPGSRRVWTDARIEMQLRRFLAGRDVWPRVSEFNDAGLASLFTAAYTYGGVEYWAARMGVRRRPLRNPGRPKPRWTPARIHAELALFCGRRDSWPTRKDFEAVGLIRLYWAAQRVGGMAHWRAELGFADRADQPLIAAA
jgi:hypothetical protein